MDIKALIFDFDGLLLDTEGPDFRSWQEEYERHGVTLDVGAWVGSIGTHGSAGLDDWFDPYADLERSLGRPIERAMIRDRRRRRYRELILAEVLRPGVSGYLAVAGFMALRLAVVSSSTCDWVHEHLDRLGVSDAFECVAGRDSVDEAANPNPDAYFRVLDLLGVSASETIAFEDSPKGVTAAKAAGVFCVAVPCQLTKGLCFDEADLTLESLADVSLAELLARNPKQMRIPTARRSPEAS